MGSDVDAVTKSGRLFHTRAADTGKARSPTVDSRDGGTTDKTLRNVASLLSLKYALSVG